MIFFANWSTSAKWTFSWVCPLTITPKTIGSIVQTIQSGILRGFPRERAVIINADGGA